MAEEKAEAELLPSKGPVGGSLADESTDKATEPMKVSDEYADNESFDEPRDEMPICVDESQQNLITYGRKRAVILDEAEDGYGEPTQGDEMATYNGEQTTSNAIARTSDADIGEAEKHAVAEPKASRKPYDKNLKYRLQLLKEEQNARRSKVLLTCVNGPHDTD